RPRHPGRPRRTGQRRDDDPLPRRRSGGPPADDLPGPGAARADREGARRRRAARGPRSDPALARGRLPRADRRGRRGRRRVKGLALVGHQFRYDQKAFWRNPASVFFTVMFPVILFLILAVVFSGEDVDVRGGIDATTYYVPAIMSLAIISATMQTL